MARGGNNGGSNSDERGFAQDPERAAEAGSEGGSQNTPEQQRARRENIKKAQKSRQGGGKQ